MARLRNSPRTLSVIAVMVGASAPAHADIAEAIRSRGVDHLRVVTPFSSDNAEIEAFARAVVGESTGVEAGERLYRAIIELKHQRRILGDRENEPKARMPSTGVEVLRRALDDTSALPAGCYELTSAFVAAARVIGIPARGMAAVASVAEGRIGHVVATVPDREGVRPMVFDLQNESMTRSDEYRPLTDLQLVAHHYNHLAVAHHLRGELYAALTAVDDALLLAPMEPAFLNNRSTTLTDLGDFFAARAEVAHAIAAAPDVAVYRFQWGRVELLLGEVDVAIRAFRSALELSPSYGRARLELGWALALGGRLADARRELTAARGAQDVAEEATMRLAAIELKRGTGSAQALIGALPASAERDALETIARGGTISDDSRVSRIWKALE